MRMRKNKNKDISKNKTNIFQRNGRIKVMIAW